MDPDQDHDQEDVDVIDVFEFILIPILIFNRFFVLSLLQYLAWLDS